MKAKSRNSPRRRTPATCEQCWPLVGQRRGGVWLLRKLGRTSGSPTRVTFDGAAALAREETRGDLLGFLHTHPGMSATPSQRDVDTMRAWVSSLGKPLLCLIEGNDGLAGYRFDDDECRGERMKSVHSFSRGVIVVVDDGPYVTSSDSNV